MSEPNDPRSDDSDLEDEDDEEISSPFDHPFFLPVLLYAFALWFGYDGWFSEKFAEGGESAEYLNFNRYGFGVLMVLAVYFTVQGVRETRESSDEE